MEPLIAVIQRAADVKNESGDLGRQAKFRIYSVSNFRGGIGKSTLSFNLAYALSKKHQSLILDLCPQRNMTQSLLGENLNMYIKNIYDALISELTGTNTVDYNDIIEKVTSTAQNFVDRDSKRTYVIPGSQELFLFPSLLYSQLAQYLQLTGQHGLAPSARALSSIKKIIENASHGRDISKILIDTSPFFGGATHLAWCASDALIIPVRVDQHSIEALRLTLDMLGNKESEFHKFNKQAGLTNVPKVHAIVMTHCGWSRKGKNDPDSSTKFFLQKALDISFQYKYLFSEEKIENCFYLLDDFLSSGRISGKLRIPIAKLNAGEKHSVDGQRLQVNPSVDRYKLEIENLAKDL